MNNNKELERATTLKMPFEGDDGLYYQVWHAMCLSSDIEKGTVKSVPFLGGQVAVFRGDDGKANVVSSYCPHFGADLSKGDVVDNSLRCPFHHWEFDGTGRCVKTAIGDTPPAKARIFTFPTVEHYGIIWAFNGEEADFELPNFEKPDSEIATRAFLVDHEYQCDWWIFAVNTPDFQHIRSVHGLDLGEDPHALAEWPDGENGKGFQVPLDLTYPDGTKGKYYGGNIGPGVFFLQGIYEGEWWGTFAGFTCPEPGKHEMYHVIAVDKADGESRTQEFVEQRLDFYEDMLRNIAMEDVAILDHIHYKVGRVTAGDKTLARFLRILKQTPRANPAAPFLK